jgi:hypothetical protein
MECKRLCKAKAKVGQGKSQCRVRSKAREEAMQE